MRIALVIEMYDPAGGGAERSTAEIATALRKRGHELTVLTGECPESVDRGGMTIEIAPGGRTRGVLPLAKFARWVSGQVFDRFDASLSMTTIAPASIVQPHAGLYVQLHRRSIARRRSPAARWGKAIGLTLSPRQRLLRHLEARTLRDPRVQRIAAISQHVAADLTRHYALSAERIEPTPLGVDRPAVSEAQLAQWRADIREGFNIPDNATAYLFPAFDPWRKGFEPLLAALAQAVQDHGVPAVLMVAGASSSYRLHHAAEKAGVRDQVRFIGRTEQMLPLYAAADVTVLPTFYDSFGRVLVESLYLGRPAITTRYAGAADLVTPKGKPPRGRVLAEADDVAALTSAMVELANPAMRQQCRAAMGAMDDAWTVPQHVDRLTALLEQVAARGGRASSARPEGHAVLERP